MKHKKLTAILLAVFLVFSFTLSFLFVVARSNHSCCDDNCRICCGLSACLNSFSADRLILILIITGIFIWLTLDTGPAELPADKSNRTPVKLKVLMLN